MNTTRRKFIALVTAFAVSIEERLFASFGWRSQAFYDETKRLHKLLLPIYKDSPYGMLEYVKQRSRYTEEALTIVVNHLHAEYARPKGFETVYWQATPRREGDVEFGVYVKKPIGGSFKMSAWPQRPPTIQSGWIEEAQGYFGHLHAIYQDYLDRPSRLKQFTYIR